MNRVPALPFDDDAFDAVTCAVSVQYITHPLQLFREVGRVLRQDGPFVVTFSNRCFPTKAVAVWLHTTDEQHQTLVRTYFDSSGGWKDVSVEDRSPGGDANPLFAVWARRA